MTPSAEDRAREIVKEANDPKGPTKRYAKLIAQALFQAQESSYEQGYKDGESSGYADWIAAFSEQLKIESIGAYDAVTKVQQKLRQARLDALESAAKIAEKCDCEDGFQCGCREFLSKLIRESGRAGR